MNKIVAQILIFGASIGQLGCAGYPTLPELHGQSAVVLGFSTANAIPYEGGTLYTGFWLQAVDDQPIEPISRYGYLLLKPGEHRLQGNCYWRLRSVMSMEDDINEAGELRLLTRGDHVYTIQSDIDEYHHQCKLTVVERPQP